MIPRPLDSCTKCGRAIPSEEVAHVSYSDDGDTLELRIICALHTDHEIAGNWHEESGED